MLKNYYYIEIVPNSKLLLTAYKITTVIYKLLKFIQQVLHLIDCNLIFNCKRNTVYFYITFCIKLN